MERLHNLHWATRLLIVTIGLIFPSSKASSTLYRHPVSDEPVLIAVTVLAVYWALRPLIKRPT